MANRLRGEISAFLDGRDWTLVLTLGALAELEDNLDLTSLQALVERFASGNMSSRDLIRVIGAGLRGAGNDVTDEQVADMTTTGGLAGFAAIASDLLHVTFGGTDQQPLETGEVEGHTRPPFAPRGVTLSPDRSPGPC